MATTTNTNTNVGQAPAGQQGPKKASKPDSSSTESWLPVKDIKNGCIILTNNWKVSGVKIVPRNIFILDEESQTSVLVSLKNLYNQVDYEFWILAIDKPVDVALYESQLQMLMNNTNNPKIQKLIREDQDKIGLFKDNDVVDKEYYFLFRSDKDDVIQKRVRDLINWFTSSGLVTMHTTNEDMRVLLDNFLNGGKMTEFGTVLLS